MSTVAIGPSTCHQHCPFLSAEPRLPVRWPPHLWEKEALIRINGDEEGPGEKKTKAKSTDRSEI